MRKAALALALCGGIIGFGIGAHASDREPIKHAAVVRCAHLAEDSAAHLRLVVYTPRADGSVRLVYRCERKGY